MPISNDGYWTHTGRLVVPIEKGFRGARSLQNAAIECLLHNIADITLEAIGCLPISTVQRVWNIIKRRCTMCFNTWSIFSKLLRGHGPPEPDLIHYRHTITDPRLPLTAYGTVLTSKPFDFITSLTITCSFTTPDFLKLSSITNLGLLTVTNGSQAPTHGFSDYLVRAWYLAALNDGAFRVLRVLRLWGFEELTNTSFGFVCSFPSLAIFEVRSSKFILNGEIHMLARESGWTIAPGVSLYGSTMLLNDMCQKRAASTIVSGVEARTLPRAKSSWDDKSDNSLKVSPAQILSLHSKGNARTREQVPSNVFYRDEVRDSSTHIDVQEEPALPSDFEDFARRGELRDDSDLKQAMSEMRGCTALQSDSVNTIPMMSLCLGPPVSNDSKRTETNITFIRIEIPSYKESREASNTNANVVASTKKASSVRRQAGPVLRANKRQKVKDVLSSFTDT